jgi:hypothetical protein
MKKTLSMFILILMHELAVAQISTVLPSSLSIANTSVSDTRNWMAFDNPANLGYVEQPEFGFQFENKYIISELSTKSLQVGLPTKLLNVGVSLSHFGFSLYNEMLVGVGFARNYSDKFSMGLQFNYYAAYFNSSNSYRGAFLPQVGLSVRLSPTFNLGFQTFNPFQTNIQTELAVKKLPSVFSLGTEYFFSKELVWRSQVDKEMSSNYRFATGFEYQVVDVLGIKMGAYQADYLVPCLGIDLNTKNLRFDLNCDIHPLLGIAPFAAVKYRFNSSK